MSTRVGQKVKTDTPINLLDLRSFKSSLKSHSLWVTLYIYISYICVLCSIMYNLHICTYICLKDIVKTYLKRYLFPTYLLISAKVFTFDVQTHPTNVHGRASTRCPNTSYKCTRAGQY